MRQVIFLCLLIIASVTSFAQATYKLKADSVKISNDAANAELILENSTKNVSGGFLYNKGNGRTEFRKVMVKINDSTYLFGSDTLHLNLSGNANFYNSNGYLTGDRGIDALGYSVGFTNLKGISYEFIWDNFWATKDFSNTGDEERVGDIFSDTETSILTNGDQYNITNRKGSLYSRLLIGDAAELMTSQNGTNYKGLKVLSNGNITINSLATGLTAPTTIGTTKMVTTDANGLLSFTDAPSLSKAVSFQSPTASENVSLWYTPVALTITEVGESIRGTTPSVTYNIRYAATRDAASPTAVFSSDRAVTSVSGTTVSTFANASIPAGSWIWITTSATSGTVNDFNATIIYRQ
jgi:hypothetical protein